MDKIDGISPMSYLSIFCDLGLISTFPFHSFHLKNGFTINMSIFLSIFNKVIIFQYYLPEPLATYNQRAKYSYRYDEYKAKYLKTNAA